MSQVILAQRGRAGIGTVVSLLEAHEVRELALSDEPALCEAQGIEFMSFPIKDRGTPQSIKEMALLIDGLVARLRDGTAVAIHCRAGIGRSGLVAACVMKRLGTPFAEIFPVLTKARGATVPDTQVQVEWVEAYGRK